MHRPVGAYRLIGNKKCTGQCGGWVVGHNFPSARYVVCITSICMRMWNASWPLWWGHIHMVRTQLWRHQSSWTNASLKKHANH